jgi:hypothetical protein
MKQLSTKFSISSGNKPTESVAGKPREPWKGPLKCWGCREEHLLRDCPHRQETKKTTYTIQEVATMNDSKDYS